LCPEFKILQVPWKRNIPSGRNADVASTRLCSSEARVFYKATTPRGVALIMEETGSTVKESDSF
jgi:hypothetical protein